MTPPVAASSKEKKPITEQDCERSLLSSLILDPSLMVKVSQIVKQADFIDKDYGILFGAFVTLHNGRRFRSDPTLLRRELQALKVEPKLTDTGFIAELIACEATSRNAMHYAERIARASRLRDMQKIGESLAYKATDESADPSELSEWVDAQLMSIGQRQGISVRPLRAIADDLIGEMLDELVRPRNRGLFTGLQRVDALMGAIQPGELLIVAARPGRGKTSLGMQVALYAAESGKSVLFVSLEMKDRELVLRVLCSRAGIDSKQFRSAAIEKADVQALHDAKEAIQNGPMIYQPSRATIDNIRGVAKLTKAVHGLDLLIVDYIGLVRATNPKLARHEHIGFVSSTLKEISKELDCVVMALCQLNRESDGERPKLSHLRDSGSIEQDADIVLFSHWDDRELKAEQPCELIVAKHRHGETGKIDMRFIRNQTRFDAPDFADNHFNR